MREVPEQLFKDVPANAYYYEAVKWAQEKGITGGIGNGLFGPNDPCTRAQIVTFLWRAAGSPAPKNTGTAFGDVKLGSFYEQAVAWAVENGITGGTGEAMFSPDATCTRAQSVTFLVSSRRQPRRQRQSRVQRCVHHGLLRRRSGVGSEEGHHHRHRRWTVRLRQRLHPRSDRDLPLALQEVTS